MVSVRSMYFYYVSSCEGDQEFFDLGNIYVDRYLKQLLYNVLLISATSNL